MAQTRQRPFCMEDLDFNRARALCTDPVCRALLEVATNHSCHLVGGAVRDALLGRSWHDIDLLVDGEGARIARRLAEKLGGRLVDLGGEAFASWRIVIHDHAYDLWDRAGASLEAELGRRDLTANAIAVSLPEAQLIDPFGGIEDLRGRRLVATREDSFQRDPLRVVRVVRICAELETFDIEARTLQLARQSAPAVESVASERVRDECMRMLRTPKPWLGFSSLVRTDLYPRLWGGSTASNPEAVAAALGEALPRAIARVNDIEAFPTLNREAIALAADRALLGGLSQPATGRHHLAERKYRTRAWIDRIRKLEAWSAVPGDEAGQRRFLHLLGNDWNAAVVALLSLGATPRTVPEFDLAAVVDLARLAADDGAQIFDPPRLLTGDEAMALLGLAAGPELGRVLDAVRAAQVQGRLRTREDARRYLMELKARGVIEET